MTSGFVSIYTEPTSFASSGQRYRVWHNDDVLIETAKDPLCEAARALLAAGGADVDDQIISFDRKTGQPRISGRLGYVASIRVAEDQNSGPRFTAWQPYDRFYNDEE